MTVVANPSGQIPSGLERGDQGGAATTSSSGSTGTRCCRPATSHGRRDPGGDRRGQRRRHHGGRGRSRRSSSAVAWAMTSPAGVGAARFHTGGEPGPADIGLPGRVPALRARAGRRLRRALPAGRGLGAEPPDPRVRRPDLVRARAARHLPAAGHGSARSASQYFHYGRWRRVVARHARGHDQPALPGAARRRGRDPGRPVAGLAGAAGARLAGAGGLWPLVLVAGLRGARALPARHPRRDRPAAKSLRGPALAGCRSRSSPCTCAGAWAS